MSTKPKVLAYYPLLYGKEYLRESILSIEPCVEKVVIVYTPHPSFGHSAANPCPETEDELKEVALSASNKVEWLKVEHGFGTESAHRQFIYNFSDGYDLVLAVDADEVWDTDVLMDCLHEAVNIDSRYIQVAGFINFWRSFNHACYDHFQPVRITNLHSSNETWQGVVRGMVYHFSLAQDMDMIRWKWSVHGHKDEMRADFFDKLENWHPGIGDLHPTSIGLWNAVEFDKHTMPDILKQHPNFSKDRI